EVPVRGVDAVAYEGDAMVARRQGSVYGLDVAAGQPDGLRAGRGVDPRGHRASVFFLKLIGGATIGAGRRARLGQLDVHPRVHGPQRCLRTGTIDGQIVSLDEYGLSAGGGRRFCAHGVSWKVLQRRMAVAGGMRDSPQTLVSQCWYLGLRPLTTSKNAFCSFSV